MLMQCHLKLWLCFILLFSILKINRFLIFVVGDVVFCWEVVSTSSSVVKNCIFCFAYFLHCGCLEGCNSSKISLIFCKRLSIDFCVKLLSAESTYIFDIKWTIAVPFFSSKRRVYQFRSGW